MLISVQFRISNISTNYFFSFSFVSVLKEKKNKTNTNIHTCTLAISLLLPASHSNFNLNKKKKKKRKPKQRNYTSGNFYLKLIFCSLRSFGCEPFRCDLDLKTRSPFKGMCAEFWSVHSFFFSTFSQNPNQTNERAR